MTNNNSRIKITKAWGTYDRNGNLLPNAGPKQTDYTPIEVLIISKLNNISIEEAGHFIVESFERKQEETKPIKYGCHCDLEPGQEPDNCVFDGGNIHDCVNAIRLNAAKIYNIGTPDKTICEHWKPIGSIK